jgi:hypothetical protein
MVTPLQTAPPSSPPDAPHPSTAPPRAPRRWVMWTALAVALALTAAAVGAFVWQRGETRVARDALAAAVSERDDALVEALSLSARVDRLRGRLADASVGTEELTARLDAAQERLEAMLGPALGDGRHFGALVAVGADQDPPRLAIDVQQWFTGAAADEAAAEDGALPPGETHVPNDYYIRNQDTRWRILPIDPAAQVAMTVYPYGDPEAPRTVTLTRFAELFADAEGSVRWFPYWVTVRDGVVVEIEQQYIP